MFDAKFNLLNEEIDMLKMIVGIVVSIIFFAIASCMVMPKYELYVDAENGHQIYRFNKITGSFDSLLINNTWGSGIVDYIASRGIRRPGSDVTR